MFLLTKSAAGFNYHVVYTFHFVVRYTLDEENGISFALWALISDLYFRLIRVQRTFPFFIVVVACLLLTGF